MAGPKVFGISRILGIIRGEEIDLSPPTTLDAGVVDGSNEQQTIPADSPRLLATAGFLYGLVNNTADIFSRVRATSRNNLESGSGFGSLQIAAPPNWSLTATPAAATRAGVTRAAVGSTVHVCTGIFARLIIPPAVNQPAITLNLRNGASGLGTVLWSQTFGVGAAVAGGLVQDVMISGLSIPGTANTDMTLEFSAAGVGTTLQSVSLTGYSTL